MVDIESEVFTEVATALRAKFDPLFVTGEYVAAPSTFPAVSITESDNFTEQQFVTNGSTEYATVLYEVNAYSNKTVGKKTEVRSIMKAVDAEMTRLGFRRTMSNPIPNIADMSIYRQVARYEAVANQDNKIFRRA